MDNGVYDSYTRLRDLSDKEASELLKNVFNKLEQAGTSADLSEIADNLNISPLLLDDIVQVMIIKGWLELPQE
jgi:predicted DNA-binding ArsR family transcriptional regulator